MNIIEYQIHTWLERKQGHIQAGPGGRGTKEALRKVPKPPQSGGWEGGTHVYPWETVERCLQLGAEIHGQDSMLYLCEKKARLGRVTALFMGWACKTFLLKMAMGDVGSC
jgi:hypothetical protein